MQLKKGLLNRAAGLAMVIALLGLFVAAPAVAQEPVTIDITAQNIAFDTSEITVPAGADVTVNFDNEDEGISHNVAFYTDSSAQTPIYVGEIITGISSVTYNFTAPSEPGTYFFRCDVHPTIMTGDFIVSSENATQAPEQFNLITGWYKGNEIQYYNFGSDTPLVNDVPLTAPIYVMSYGTDNGTPQLVSGQHNIVDVVQGDEGYSDLWQVNLVEVPQDYEADSIRSVDEIMSANYTVTTTDTLVNCPIVPEGSTLENGELELTQGWYKGQAIYYFNFGDNPDITAPIWVPSTGLDDQGNPITVDGQYNIIDVKPGDDGYSAFWRVNLVEVPQDYQANSLMSFTDVQDSGFTVTQTDTMVNCPVVTDPVSGNISGAPPEVNQYLSDWPLPQHDYNNTRATTDSSIDSGNAANLTLAWSLVIPGSSTFGSAATIPIIMGDTVYFQDLENNIYAINKNDGTLIWQKMYNIPNIGPNGVAVGWGKVFAAASPFDMVALDMNTGEEMWRTPMPIQSHEGMDIQPLLYNNLVLVASVPGNSVGNYYAGGAIGTIYALDQETGEIVWSFDTVDSADIWGNAQVNSGGGCWYPPAVDTDNGTTYWAVANPAPWPGTTEYPNGSSRPGDNLYTNSLVALDADGNLLWYNQVLPHDIRDYDLQQSPIMTSASVNGTQQNIAIVAGKMGRIYAISTDTGELLWETPVGQHENDLLTELPTDNTSVTILPGFYGGVETPMAYADGVVYAAVVNLAATMDGTGSIREIAPFNQGTGQLVAVNVSDGTIMWTADFDSVNFGGATIVNDLVFTGTFDGTIYALDRQTGDQVFSYMAPAGINGWPAVSGDMIIWPAGQGGIPSLIALSPAQAEPILNIVMPEDNATIQSGNVTVEVQVLNFDLVNKFGEPAQPGEGHLYFYMDVEVPTTPGVPAATVEPNSYQVTENTSVTWDNVTQGQHTFAAQLVNNDHTPLEPPVVASVTVMASDAWITITSPSPEAISTISDNTVTVDVDVSNFTLGEGAGQIIYYLDVEPPTTQGEPATTTEGTYMTSTDTSATWDNLDSGLHIFYAQLVNNDLTPLDIPVVARTVVIISPQGQQTGP